MSVELYDSNGYVGPVASNKGWSDVLAVVDGVELLETGQSDFPLSSSIDLMVWLTHNPTSPEDIKSTLTSLSDLLRGCEFTAKISDGVA